VAAVLAAALLRTRHAHRLHRHLLRQCARIYLHAKTRIAAHRTPTTGRTRIQELRARRHARTCAHCTLRTHAFPACTRARCHPHPTPPAHHPTHHTHTLPAPTCPHPHPTPLLKCHLEEGPQHSCHFILEHLLVASGFTYQRFILSLLVTQPSSLIPLRGYGLWHYGRWMGQNRSGRDNAEHFPISRGLRAPPTPRAHQPRLLCHGFRAATAHTRALCAACTRTSWRAPFALAYHTHTRALFGTPAANLPALPAHYLHHFLPVARRHRFCQRLRFACTWHGAHRTTFAAHRAALRPRAATLPTHHHAYRRLPPTLPTLPSHGTRQRHVLYDSAAPLSPSVFCTHTDTHIHCRAVAFTLSSAPLPQALAGTRFTRLARGFLVRRCARLAAHDGALRYGSLLTLASSLLAHLHARYCPHLPLSRQHYYLRSARGRTTTAGTVVCASGSTHAGACCVTVVVRNARWWTPFLGENARRWDARTCRRRNTFSRCVQRMDLLAATNHTYHLALSPFASGQVCRGPGTTTYLKTFLLVW